eukprot:2982709-Rhodomonas_salina.2
MLSDGARYATSGTPHTKFVLDLLCVATRLEAVEERVSRFDYIEDRVLAPYAPTHSLRDVRY